DGPPGSSILEAAEGPRRHRDDPRISVLGRPFDGLERRGVGPGPERVDRGLPNAGARGGGRLEDGASGTVEAPPEHRGRDRADARARIIELPRQPLNRGRIADRAVERIAQGGGPRAPVGEFADRAAGLVTPPEVAERVRDLLADGGVGG